MPATKQYDLSRRTARRIEKFARSMTPRFAYNDQDAHPRTDTLTAVTSAKRCGNLHIRVPIAHALPNAGSGPRSIVLQNPGAGRIRDVFSTMTTKTYVCNKSSVLRKPSPLPNSEKKLTRIPRLGLLGPTARRYVPTRSIHASTVGMSSCRDDAAKDAL